MLFLTHGENGSLLRKKGSEKMDIRDYIQSEKQKSEEKWGNGYKYEKTGYTRSLGSYLKCKGAKIKSVSCKFYAEDGYVIIVTLDPDCSVEDHKASIDICRDEISYAYLILPCHLVVVRWHGKIYERFACMYS